MPKVSPGQSDFSSGEISPKYYGRANADRYKAALKVCENYLPTIQGSLARRPGTRFVAEVKDSSAQVRLAEFEFSVVQNYVLEFGGEYLRFFTNGGQVVEASKSITAITQASPGVITSTAHGYDDGDEIIISGVVGMTQLNGRHFRVANKTTDTYQLTDLNDAAVSTSTYTAYTSGGISERVYEVATPWAAADVFNLWILQSADTIYVFHPDYAPQKIVRAAATSWSISAISFIDGPYISVNDTATTLTPSSTSGSVTITASSGAGINSGGFLASDIGRLIRMSHSGTWSWATITAVGTSTSITATIHGTTSAAPTSVWRLGLWSDTTGYPACACFYEDRLVLAGGNLVFPQRVDMSVTSDYENFAPTAADGTVTDDLAMSYILNSQNVNSIKWLSSEERGLFVGTQAGEWIVQPFTAGSALSPTNISAKQFTSYGSGDVQPTIVGKSTMFVSRTGRKLREIAFVFDEDGFRAPDRTLLADHISGSSGFKQMAYQKDPQSFLWCVRNDGQLASMTFERDQDVLIVGWARHVLGGVDYLDSASTAKVESIAIIPSEDGLREDVWLVVNRRFYADNGIQEKRYVEYITRLFEDDMSIRDSFFVDSGLSYDNPLDISNITSAGPGVFTSAAHGMSAGDKVRITGVEGFTFEGEGINENIYYLTSVTTDTFQVKRTSGGNPFAPGINFSFYTAYEGGGVVRKFISTVSGLEHLNGSNVDICADGCILKDVPIAAGVISLGNFKATTVHIGLPSAARGQRLRDDAGSADGTATGKNRRTNHVGFQLYRSLGLKFGMSFDEMNLIAFRDADVAFSEPADLFTGIKAEPNDAGYDFDNELCFMQDDPLPSNILAVLPQFVTQDRN